MNENDLLGRLERVERTLRIYDNSSEDILQELEVSASVDELKRVVVPKEGDDQLYDGYLLDELQLNKLKELLGYTFEPDFNKNYYVLECQGVYCNQNGL